jgi:hypothetical protein
MFNPIKFFVRRTTMLKRNLLIKFSSLMLATSMLAATPAIIHAAQGTGGGTAATQSAAINAWRPTRPAAGMASLVLLNSFGSGAPLTIDLQRGNLVSVREDKKNTHQFIIDSENLYTLPEATNSGMGHLQLNLAPGTYNYTASVPNVGTMNGTIEVTPGQVIGLSFYGGGSRTVVHNHSQSHGDNTKPTSESVVFTKLLVAQEDMTAQAG